MPENFQIKTLYNNFKSIHYSKTLCAFGHRFNYLLPPLVLILSNIFLFGPFEIYRGNLNEFTISLSTALRLFIFPALILFLILCMLGLLFPEMFFRKYVSLLLTLGLLLWLQGNIIVWDYGLADGRGGNWEHTSWRGWIDGVLWIGLLILGLVLHKRVFKISKFIGIALFSLQLIYLVFISVQTPAIWRTDKGRSIVGLPPDELFEFSTQQNIIHVVLDELQTTVFEEIINRDNSYFSDELEGFTFFEETIASFPTTTFSMPAILAAQHYGNSIPVEAFIDSVYKGATLPNVLFDHGFDVDLIGPFGSWWWCKGRYTNCYEIPVPYGMKKQAYEQKNAVILLDLVLFRYVPHFLKNFNFKTQFWISFFHPVRNTNPVKEFGKGLVYYEGARHFSHKALLQDFIDKMSVKRERPLYKFIHLTTTHYPAVLNEQCEYAGRIVPWEWDNIRIQAECSFDHFMEFIKKLKDIGVYDSAFIIVHADHGYWKTPDSAAQLALKNEDKALEGYSFDDREYFSQIVCSALPLLAIKLPNGQGPLRRSKAQAMISDIPATVSSTLNIPANFDGRSVFEIDKNENRERKYYYYDALPRGRKYLKRLDEFIIRGPANDKTSWNYITSHIHPPSLSPSQYRVFQKIDVRTKSAAHFLRAGWSKNEGSRGGTRYKWALGKSASLWYSFPKDKAVRLTVNVKSPQLAAPQIITIKVDGKKIGNWKLSSVAGDWETHSIIIASDENRPELSIIDFQFSQYRKPDKKERRLLSVLFDSITFSKITSEVKR